MITRASFCCSKKVRKLHLFSTKVAFMRRKLHLCAHLTAKDLTQPIFVCMDLAKSQDFPLFHLELSSGTVVLGWGWKTSSLQTNETQLIRHNPFFMQSKRIELNWNSFLFFNYTFTFCATLEKHCSKKLHAKIENVAKSCNITTLETAQNIELHVFWVFRKL